MAFSVAKFTDAATPLIAPSFFSTRAAHAAHVMPRIESSTSLSSGADTAPEPQPMPFSPAFRPDDPASARDQVPARQILAHGDAARHRRTAAIYTAVNAAGNIMSAITAAYSVRLYPRQV